MNSKVSVFGMKDVPIEPKKAERDFSKENDIFKLSVPEFYREIASAIPSGEGKAITLVTLYDKFITKVDNIPLMVDSDEEKNAYVKYRDKTTRRVRKALVELEEKHPTLMVCELNGYYWESIQAKNLVLNKEAPQGMPLARALAYNLVSENLSNLLPPNELKLLKPFFEGAQKSLDIFNQSQPEKVKSLKYSPYATDFIIEKANTDNLQLLFQAIEEGSLIKADYDSIHGGIPEEIIFSPQQVRLQFQQTKIVGFLHNIEKNSDCTKPTQVSSKGVYRHLSVNRMSNIKLIAGKYKKEHQEMISMAFSGFAHEWVARSLNSAKFSDDQVITPWKDMSPEDQAHCRKLRKEQPEAWCKVTATITLPKKFLNTHDEYDAWFFVNAISIYGSDLIATEPCYVVNEIKRRVTEQKFAYDKT